MDAIAEMRWSRISQVSVRRKSAVPLMFFEEEEEEGEGEATKQQQQRLSI